MTATALRPRSATEIVDAAFRIYGAHYTALLTATAVAFAPGLIAKLLLPAETDWVGELFQNLLGVIADGAVIAIVSEAYLGRAADARTGLGALRGRMGALLWASIGRNLLIGIGLVLLIVPGLIAVAWTFAMPMAIVLEGCDADDAFGRARELARGHVGRILATLALLIVLFFILLMTIAAVLGGAGAVFGMGDGLDGVFGDVALIVTYPLLSVGGTLLYYDLRIRKEGFDLEVMARELGGEAALSAAVEGSAASAG